MKAKRAILTALGFTSLGLGLVGIAIPVLPTTPFVLLAAICFSASNEKMEAWLIKNRIFGPYIEQYRNKLGISKKRKLAAIIFVWTGLTISMIVTQVSWLYILLPIIGVCVTIHLLLIKTRV